MLPITSPQHAGCTPTSSNCVIWAGPDIPCIGLCTGQSLTQGFYELAQLICASAEGLVDLTSLELKCLVDETKARPADLTKLLQVIIDEICTLGELVEQVGTTPGDGAGTPGPSLSLRLPVCMQYLDEDGETVTALPHSDFSKLTATTLCTLITDFNTLTNQHKALVKRVSDIEHILQESGIGQDLMVQLKCLMEPGEIEVEAAILLVESVVCEIRELLGSKIEVLSAISRECLGLNQSPQLVDALHNMEELDGWKNAPKTLSDTITNIWLTLCDTRAGVISLKSLLRASCDNVVLDFDFEPAGNGQTGDLRLFSYTTLPLNFRSAVTSHLTLDDGTKQVDVPVDIANLTRSAGSKQNIGLKALGLNINHELTLTLQGDLLDDEDVTCRKSKTRTVSAFCSPRPITDSSLLLGSTFDTVVVQFDLVTSLPTYGSTVPDYYKIFWYPSANIPVFGSSDPSTYAGYQEVVVYPTVTLPYVINGLDSSTEYVVGVIAVHVCGASPRVSKRVTTQTPIVNTLGVRFVHTGSESGSVAYLRVNGVQVSQNQPRQDFTSTPDGKFLIDYAVSGTLQVIAEVGILHVDTIPSGITLRSRDGVYEYTVTLDQLVDNSTHDVIYNVFSDFNQNDIDDDIEGYTH